MNADPFSATHLISAKLPLATDFAPSMQMLINEANNFSELL